MNTKNSSRHYTITINHHYRIQDYTETDAVYRANKILRDLFDEGKTAFVETKSTKNSKPNYTHHTFNPGDEYRIWWKLDDVNVIKTLESYHGCK